MEEIVIEIDNIVNVILQILQTFSIICVLIAPYIKEVFCTRRLRKGLFVGEPWQKELFIELVFLGRNRSKDQQKPIVILDTSGWTKKDLSKYGGYSPEMIQEFYSNRDRIMHNYDCDTRVTDF